MSKIEETFGGKFFLFLFSIMFGLIGGLVVHEYNSSILISFTVGSIVAILNPFIAALAVYCSETLCKWSFPEDYVKWSVTVRTWHAAFWPITVIFWVVVSIFFAAINRLFK